VTTRIDARFAALKKEGRSAFITFVMAGDPDPATSLDIIKALPKAGSDVIEIGMPFTDPMADGPAIQAAGLRALKAGMTLKKTLSMVREFRKDDNATPLVLMGYYNPIYIYGVDKFLVDAKSAGVDGLIIVDLPPEEFITFVMAGDPDPATSLDIIKALPKAGSDIIEIGMPFTDPMADGPAIQAAGLRALKSGMTLKKTLSMVREFRKDDNATPLVLMGYYNPIYIYGVDKFLVDAKSAGVDGLIIVDLPPEEDIELCLPAMKAGLNFIRLATPTTDDKRLPAVLSNTSGFVYYVSITGITGSASADSTVVGQAVARIKRHTKLPVCVGFGIRTPEAARAIAENADGAVVGTALVDALRCSLDSDGKATAKTVSAVADLAAALAQGVREARQPAE